MSAEKIVIALDSFKGSISSWDAGRAIAGGLVKAGFDGEIIVLPAADGGEGMVDGLLRALGGNPVDVVCRGPLGKQLTARYAFLPERPNSPVTAAMEMASSSGLPLLPPNERNPLKTSTWGAGDQLLDAVKRGAERVLFGIGGSATVDGGMGAAVALGVRFLDKNGRELPGRGEDTLEARSVDLSGLADLSGVEINIACDVDNLLLGPEGAAAVYGPQKGGAPESIALLEAGITNLYNLLEPAVGRRARNLPGSGAAGGLGAMLALISGARMMPGAEILLDAVGFREALRGAKLVITGEGRLDYQTARGKAPSVAAKIAKEAGVTCIAVCGMKGEGADELAPEFFSEIHALTDLASSETTMGEPVRFLEELGRKIAGIL